LTLTKLSYLSYNRVGRNVAAGMTGGLAYILDEDDTLIPKVCDSKLHLVAFGELVSGPLIVLMSFPSLIFSL
jgi:hypothetical protein